MGGWPLGKTMAAASLGRTGCPGTDCPAGAFVSLTFPRFVLPDQGMIFLGEALPRPARGVTAANSQGIWAVDTSSGRLRL